MNTECSDITPGNAKSNGAMTGKMILGLRAQNDPTSSRDRR
jgi:hypothetical protein